MTERKGVVFVNDNPLTLIGHEVRVGEMAPEFTAVDNSLSTVSLSDYKGRVVILSAVTSLDTEVCDAETRRFNTEAASLADDVAILTISMDLPFTAKRWCGAAGIERVTTLSDHREADFGMKYGVLLKNLRFLARSVFVIDRQGVIQHIDLVRDQSHEPDYETILDKVRELS